MTDESEYDAPGNGPPNIRKRVTWAIGILAGVATIITLIVELWPSQPFTIQEWAQEANEVCDETSGEIEHATQEAVDSMAVTLQNWRSGQAEAGNFTYGGNLFITWAGLQDKQAGRLSDIKEPNSQKVKVSGIIADYRKANNSLYGVARILRSADSENMDATASQYETQSNSYDREVESINDRLAEVGADSCVPNF